ncbi:hypothetical protein F8568_022545 [Actinomadura sp. LD22]|uniref:Uncharacterized protein n=1 Tax=Actinomadura physcomitrii TaxID=2650748 RepID=A0A6I4MDN9_9ACTN|nr:hypothetical protein [Actinomadura physcomitrii]MWA02324.1 hypothetical protein [Actinomadura physcomitrii]MWA03104.1 hypothetical protein [Actinomadura physcomitrii]
MTEAGAEEFAEFGAAALDSFQALFEQTEHLDHRTNDEDARELISDLLVDLMHYAERRGIEFNDIAAEAQAYYDTERDNPNAFAIGSTVQLEGPAADEAILLGQPTRGTVTGVLVSEQGQTEYYVHFLGQTQNQPVLAADLEPARPFPTTPTNQGDVHDPLKAEQLLVDAATRIAAADVHSRAPSQDDLRDHQTLLAALTTWNDMHERNVTDLLLNRVAEHLNAAELDDTTKPAPRAATAESTARLTPAQLAAQAFPVPLADSIAGDQKPATTRASRTRQPPPNPSR